jgi:hypothetical protein
MWLFAANNAFLLVLIMLVLHVYLQGLSEDIVEMGLCPPSLGRRFHHTHGFLPGTRDFFGLIYT